MNLTTKIIVGATAALVVYDVYAADTQERGDTISEVIATAARRRPIIAVAAGVVIGHWFWPMASRGRVVKSLSRLEAPAKALTEGGELVLTLRREEKQTVR